LFIVAASRPAKDHVPVPNTLTAFAVKGQAASDAEYAQETGFAQAHFATVLMS
jgi:hypothetical protein